MIVPAHATCFFWSTPMSTRCHWQKRNAGGRCYGADAPGNRAPGYSLGEREFPPYDGRVKITMSVTLAPELTEAIKESAARQGLSVDDWIVAAAELKFRADGEAAVFEEAARQRGVAGLGGYIDEKHDVI